MTSKIDKAKKDKLRKALLAVLDYVQDDKEWDDFCEHNEFDPTKDLSDPDIDAELKKSDHVYAMAQRIREALDDGKLLAVLDDDPKPMPKAFDTTKNQDKLVNLVYDDGSLPFDSAELYDDMIRDALKWFADNKIQGLIDDSAGGIIAYVRTEHCPRIARLLNAAVCSQHHQL